MITTSFESVCFVIQLFFFVFAAEKMEFACMQKVINDRDSVRVFNGKKIEEGVLEEILGYSLVIYFCYTR